MNIWRHRRCELVPEGGGLRLRLYERDAPASGRPGAAPEHAPQASARLLAEYAVHEAVSIPERDNKRSHRFDVRATAATAGRAPQPGRERRLCFAAPSGTTKDLWLDQCGRAQLPRDSDWAKIDGIASDDGDGSV